MRIYLPATVAELNQSHLNPRTVRGVSPAWLAQVEGDVELAELLAHRMAAMDSVQYLTDGPWLRLVVSADVPDNQVTFIDETQAQITQPVTWKQVAAFHIDDDDATDLVKLTNAGDEPAAEQLWDADLLWFDASERTDLIARFT